MHKILLMLMRTTPAQAGRRKKKRDVFILAFKEPSYEAIERRLRDEIYTDMKYLNSEFPHLSTSAQCYG